MLQPGRRVENGLSEPKHAERARATQRFDRRSPRANATPARRDDLRVVVTDDPHFMRDLISRQLARQKGHYAVVAACATAEEAIHACELAAPDLLILDVMLPGLSGIEAVPLIKRVAPRTRILLCTALSADECLGAALRSGADGFVEKTNSWEDFLHAVERVGSGQQYFCTRNNERSSRAAGVARATLTARETEIVRVIARGLSTKEIAAKLAVSIDTINSHRRNLMGKLKMRNVAELVAYAFRSGLVK